MIMGCMNLEHGGLCVVGMGMEMIERRVEEVGLGEGLGS